MIMYHKKGEYVKTINEWLFYLEWICFRGDR